MKNSVQDAGLRKAWHVSWLLIYKAEKTGAGFIPLRFVYIQPFTI